MTRKTIIILIILFVFGAFLRFYNLTNTARFIHDDAYNLIDMHRIYTERDITLIGPRIGENPDFIYPSLTLYMLLPGALLGGFTTYSFSYASAFYGVLTVGLLIVLIYKLNKGFLIPATLLAVAWFPLIDSSRVPWNPHLIPLVQSAAILMLLPKRKLTYFISGILFGLTFHLHYYAFVSFIVFLLLFAISSARKRNFLPVILVAIGFFVTIVPFIYFDLKNPPGLFFGRFLRQNLILSGLGDKTPLLNRILHSFQETLLFLGGNIEGALAFVVASLLLIYIDLKNRSSAFMYLLPVLAQIAAISVLPKFEPRYFYLALIFFFVWVVYKRVKIGLYIAFSIVLILLVSNWAKVYSYLTKPLSDPSALEVNYINEYLSSSIVKKDLKNVNVAALASVDPIPLGLVYRVTLRKEGIILLAESQYGITDNLFVISTSNESTLRADPANVIDRFRRGELVDTYQVPNSLWKVYLFNRNK